MSKKCLLVIITLFSFSVYSFAQIGFGVDLKNSSGPKSGEIGLFSSYNIPGEHYFELGLSISSITGMDMVSTIEYPVTTNYYILNPRIGSYINIIKTVWGKTFLALGAGGNYILNANEDFNDFYSYFCDLAFFELGIQENFNLTKKTYFGIGFSTKLIRYSYQYDVDSIWNRPSISSYMKISFY
jgi:hypothetical protein